MVKDMNKNLANNSNYQALITSLSQSLCEHAKNGNSGELLIRYRPDYCLFEVSLETKLNPDNIRKVIQNFHNNIIAFSRDTKYNENGNEAGFVCYRAEVGVCMRKIKRLVRRICDIIKKLWLR
jgi:hypothetical protein